MENKTIFGQTFRKSIFMNIPANLKYTKDHEWVLINGDVATIGITDFVYVDINTVGQHVATNDVFGTVEAVKTVSDLFMPVDGEVIEFNADLESNPEAVNSDPYGAGWMIKVKLSASENTELMSAEQYQALVG